MWVPLRAAGTRCLARDLWGRAQRNRAYQRCAKVVILTVMMPPILAYIGPGAGFAFLGSFLSLLISLLLTAGSFLVWPFRTGCAVLHRKQGFRPAKIQRVIFSGLPAPAPTFTQR